jgi:hypothetical protein
MYDDSALDTGGGLRPDLTGQGKGREAIQTGLDFGRQQFAPTQRPPGPGAVSRVRSPGTFRMC